MATSISAETGAVGDLGKLAELSNGKLWHESAGDAVIAAWKAGGPTASWKAWRRTLRTQGRKRLAATTLLEAVTWGLGPTERPFAGRARRVLKALADKKVKKLTALVEEFLAPRKVADLSQVLYGPDADVDGALTAVLWAHALAPLTEQIDARLWWRLCGRLYDIAIDAQNLPLCDALGSPSPPPAEHNGAATGPALTVERVVVEQLLAGELPLVLSNLAPELRPLRALRKDAVARLSEGIERHTDGRGWVHRGLLSAYGALAACWTRVAMSGDAVERPTFTAMARNNYEWVVRQLIRWAPLAPEINDALIAAALVHGGDDRDSAALRARRTGRATKLSPSANSEWSGLAVMASSWRDDAHRLAITYHGAQMTLQLQSAGRTLIAGEWPIAASINGRPVQVAGDWEEQCWFSDDDADYVEFATLLEGGGRLERQVLLAKQDGLVYLAELLLTGPAGSQLLESDMRFTLPIDVTLETEKETREGMLLVGGRPRAGVIPPALAEWRSDPRHGELAAAGELLRMTRRWQGRNLCAPLVIDLYATRFRKQRTWRQLTVAQSLERVAPDVAVGYRVQSGNEQWLFYRSLDDPANRTVLGQNLSCEGFMGRFLPSGGVKEFFEIHTEDE